MILFWYFFYQPICDLRVRCTILKPVTILLFVLPSRYILQLVASGDFRTELFISRLMCIVFFDRLSYVDRQDQSSALFTPPSSRTCLHLLMMVLLSLHDDKIHSRRIQILADPFNIGKHILIHPFLCFPCNLIPRFPLNQQMCSI